jgi:hypothetical protein
MGRAYGCFSQRRHEHEGIRRVIVVFCVLRVLARGRFQTRPQLNRMFSTNVSSWICRWSKLVIFSSNSVTKYGMRSASSSFM